jgi:hypothetical protein
MDQSFILNLPGILLPSLEVDPGPINAFAIQMPLLYHSAKYANNGAKWQASVNLEAVVITNVADTRAADSML